MKILIIQTAFIGDVVLATPLVEKLKAHYPDSSIDFLLRKGNESLLKHNPNVNQVLILDKKQGKFKQVFKLIKQIRKEKYDYVINVQRFMTTGIIAAFSGAKNKIGFDKNPMAFAYSKKVKHTISNRVDVHEVHRNLSLIEHLTDNTFQKPKLYYSEEDKKIVPDYDYVCMAPSSVWFTKQFPAGKWAELIKGIPENYKVHLLGGPDDVELCTKIQHETDVNQVVVSAGKTSILESVALIDKAKMNFTNDSGPMHFASAVNAPTIAIFCSTIPAFGFGPLSDQSQVVEVEKKLDCRPCGLHGKAACPEGHFNCADISIDSILEKADLK